MSEQISKKPLNFYYYSFTNRRCIIQQKETKDFAYTLEFVGSLSGNEDIWNFNQDVYEKNHYIVTTTYGKNALQEKLESRHLPDLFSTVGWADFVQDENPKKVVNIWKIIKTSSEGNNNE